jgi:murein DD-endopeptidase MepM/ murein hydrolase activator NlpD
MKAENKVAVGVALFLVSIGAGALLSFSAKTSVANASVRAPVAAVAVGTPQLIVPVIGVAPRQLVDTFGAGRSGGRAHQGIDIMAKRGTPVRAAMPGTIAKLFTSKLGGTTIYQYDETKTYIFYYAHLEGYAAGISVGQRVEQGQVIAYVGSTGNATTPHLHFEIQRADGSGRWWKAHAMNPYPMLKSGSLEQLRTVHAGP